MTKLTNEEIKKHNLNLLIKIANFCEDNNINYILSDGTLLGCIRHNGYIPWDLDIDISMHRNDYNRFIEIWKDTENEKILSCEKNSRYGLSFIKIVDLHTVCYEHGKRTAEGGLWVDIFPFDSIPDNPIDAKLHFKKICKLYDKYWSAYNCFYDASLFQQIKRRIKRTFEKKDYFLLFSSLKRRREKLIKESSKFNNMSFKNITNNMVIGRRPENRYIGFPQTVLTEFIYGNFENKKFRIPKDYDSILKSYYKDYMTPPPKEQQIDDHKMEVFLLDELI